jgi:tetratricopeptide (TPR) repeat protein
MTAPAEIPPAIRALLAAGQMAQAEAPLRAWRQGHPAHAEACYLHGVCLAETGRAHEALSVLDRALDLDPGLDAARFARGTARLRLGALPQAASDLQDFLARQPGNAWAWNNLGLCRKALGQPAEAAAAFERALSCDPRLDLAAANLGNVLTQLGRNGAARLAYERALALVPGNALTRWNLGLCRLLLGEWPQGWLDYEARWQQVGHPLFAPRAFFDRPRWRGPADAGARRVLLHAEQGLGDTLQFCRYAALVIDLGVEVLLEVPAALKPLLQRAFEPRLRVFARGEALPTFDAHCPLLSLPLLFGSTVQTVPSRLPYLGADAQRCASWRGHLGAARRPRLGVVWSSGASNPLRNLPVAQLQALAGLDWEFLGLQTGLDSAERAALAALPWLHDLGREIADFDDTAALMTLCDAVVSVDTASAHLAGALGRPLHLLLPFAADWRWLTGRTDTPWYPGARLHRQPQAGDWRAALARLREQLAEDAARSSARA